VETQSENHRSKAKVFSIVPSILCRQWRGGPRRPEVRLFRGEDLPVDELPEAFELVPSNYLPTFTSAIAFLLAQEI
jgi:hypothetical protein